MDVNDIITDNTKERASGVVDEWAGWAKEQLAEVTNDKAQKEEGHAQQLKGQSTQESAKSSEVFRGKMEKFGASIEEGIGNLIGSEQMQMEGKIGQLVGQARQSFNK